MGSLKINYSFVKSFLMMKCMGYWPPYLGTGIRVVHFNEDLTEIDVQMTLHFWNRNYVGTHFGGSIYAMVDPFFMLMLINQLGRNYIVWDKAAVVRFKKPGRGAIKAQFRLNKDQVESFKSDLLVQGKIEPIFIVLVLDESGETIAEVEKTIYIRQKNFERPPKR